jgi:hypothetical protein
VSVISSSSTVLDRELEQEKVAINAVRVSAALRAVGRRAKRTNGSAPAAVAHTDAAQVKARGVN